MPRGLVLSCCAAFLALFPLATAISAAPASQPAAPASQPSHVSQIRPPFTFTIRVLTPDDKPVPGVNVHCVHPRSQRGPALVDMRVKSDEKGLAVFRVDKADFLTDRYFWFGVEDDDYIGNLSVGISPIDNDFTFVRRVLPIRPLDFVVQDQEGNPVSGATVWLFRPRDPQVQPGYDDILETRRANTDATGHATIRFAPGRTGIVAVAPGCASTTLDDVKLSPGKPYTITLSPGRTISGTIRDSQGKPMPGVDIVARKEAAGHYQREFELRGQTDALGRFHLPKASAGEWRLLSSAPDTEHPWFIPYRKVKVADADLDVALAASPGFRLKGRYVSKHKLHLSGGGGTYPGMVLAGRSFDAPLEYDPGPAGEFLTPPLPCDEECFVRFSRLSGFGRTIKLPADFPGRMDRDDQARFDHVAPGIHDGIELHFTPAAIIHLNLANQAGQPVTGVYVRAEPDGYTWCTDKKGRCTLQADPSHPVRCRVYRKSRDKPLLLSDPFDVQPGEILHKTLVLPD